MNGQPPPVPTAKTSGLAIASLVFGILGMTCILPVVGAIAALIMGIIALSQINKSGITVLIIEHKMRCIMELSTKVVVLNNGEMIATGTPAEIVRNPEVIKAYLGVDYNAESY